MNKKHQPTKVVKIVCPKCEEIQVKIYPWSSFNAPPVNSIPICKKCRNAR